MNANGEKETFPLDDEASAAARLTTTRASYRKPRQSKACFLAEAGQSAKQRKKRAQASDKPSVSTPDSGSVSGYGRQINHKLHSGPYARISFSRSPVMRTNLLTAIASACQFLSAPSRSQRQVFKHAGKCRGFLAAATGCSRR